MGGGVVRVKVVVGGVEVRMGWLGFKVGGGLGWVFTNRVGDNGGNEVVGIDGLQLSHCGTDVL